MDLKAILDNYWREALMKHPESVPLRDKTEHVRHMIEIITDLYPGDELKAIVVRGHDIGRILQFELLGGFDDRKIQHHVLGEQVLRQLIQRGEILDDETTDVLRAVVLYHGMPMPGYLPKETKELISLVSTLDDIENGCVGAPCIYIEREMTTPGKGYLENCQQKGINTKSVKPEVLAAFLKSEKFDKLKLVETPAEYLLFAAVLCLAQLKGKHSKLALDICDKFGVERRYCEFIEIYVDQPEVAVKHVHEEFIKARSL